MAGMPGMEPDGDEPKGKSKGKGLDIAVIMGDKPKLGDGKPAEDRGGALPPGFEAAFSEVFPDMAGDQEKMAAMKRLIGTCMSDSDDY